MYISNGLKDNVSINFSSVSCVKVDVSRFVVIFVVPNGDDILVYRSNLEGVFKVLDRMVKFNGDSLPVVYI